MSIELHIERLVIDAAVLGGERADDVRAAIERALTQQLAHPEAMATLRHIGVANRLPTTLLPPAQHPRESLGRRIATTLGNTLGVAATMAHGPHNRMPSGARP